LGAQTSWAAKWLAYGYEQPELMKALQAELQKSGFTQIPETLNQLKTKYAKVQLSENDLNAFGYSLMRKHKNLEAIEIFKLNTQLFPQSWNVYDSLGEAYFNIGNKKMAIQNYKKSLELNPNNNYAKKVIAEGEED
jgi:tetratricopeptide (TPR) repeat protein